MKPSAGPVPDTMNVNNIARSGSYGVHKTQQSIPPEVMIQMKLGPRRYALIMDASQNPQKYKDRSDTKLERDESAKHTPFLAEHSRKSEREEGVSIPQYIIDLIEKEQSPIISTQGQNTTINNKQPSDPNNYRGYNGSYGEGYGKKEKQKPRVYLSVIQSGKSKKIYSNEPADDVAARVEELSEDCEPKFKAIGKVTKSLYNLLKSAYSVVISKYENIKHKGYSSKENTDETENLYVDDVVNQLISENRKNLN